MSTASLFYRRQFILGDCPIPDLPGWKTISFESYTLTVHPNLETTLANGSYGNFLLLGFALSHRQPEANNQELMDEMAGTCCNLEEMLEFCRDLCGRYVILFSFSEKTGLVNDLIGSRTVYWCIYQNSVWCASQPSTLARILNIEEDHSPEVQSYVEREMFASGEGSWIGDGTKYLGVKHLLPNHYLDFEEQRSIRYWPVSRLEPIDIEYASHKSAEILENTMLAATNRFQLSMAVSAGWDSRTILAGTRNVQSKIFYYIQKYGGMTDNHPDIRVPRKLTQKLGIPFHIIECDDYHDEVFDAALERNVFVIHNPAKKVLYRSFFEHFQDKVNASGNISDLCRTFSGINPVHDINDLLASMHLYNSLCAAALLKDWYAEAKVCCDSFSFNLRDLFFWEQQLGNWGSMFAVELDIAIDEFYPFGTRQLVETILAVDGKLRPYQNSLVHRRIIEILWPELLSEPINPLGQRASIMSSVKNGTKSTLAQWGWLSRIKSLRSKISSE